MIRPPPTSPPFPYTTLFRSVYALRAGDEEAVEAALRDHDRWRASIERLEVPPHVAAVSSREGRDRIRGGEDVSELIPRSEEHTSELQSPCKLVCRLLLGKKK